MVKTRKTSPSKQTSKRSSLNRKSKRKRDEEDSEADYVVPSSARKRRKPGTPQRSPQPPVSARNPDQVTGEIEDPDRDEDTVLERDWYLVRAVIDERFEEGSDGETKHQYLVDWVPSHQETYQPTWELAENLNEDALKDWEKVKDKRKRVELQREAKRQNKRSRRGLRNLTPRAAQAEPVDFDERQKPWTLDEPLQNRSPSDSLRQRRRTRNSRRAEPEPALSEEPVPSIISASSVDTESVGLDEPSALPVQKVTVVLRKSDNFDPSEYQSVYTSSQRISDLEDDDQRLALASHLSQGTIPDSQDLSGQWDPRHFQSQASIQESDNPGNTVDQLPVTPGHLETDEQEEDTPRSEINSPSQSDSGQRELGSSQVDQDLELDDSEIEYSIRSQLLEDSQHFHHDDSNHDRHLSEDTESNLDPGQLSHDHVDTNIIPPSSEAQSFETANSQTSQEISNSRDSYIPSVQLTQDNTLTNGPSGSGQQVVDSPALEATVSPLAERNTHSIQGSASSYHSSAGDQDSNIDQSQRSGINVSSRPSISQRQAGTFNPKPSQRSPFPPEDAAQLEAQPSSSSGIGRVIPDSQECSGLSAESHSNALQTLPASKKAQSTPFASQVEVVPDSATTDSDIPSRQPDQSRLASLIGEDTLDESLPTDQGVDRVQRTATASIQQSFTPDNTQNTPVFFTQPQDLHDSPIISSSLSELKSTGAVKIAFGPASTQYETEDQDLVEPQAAQPRSQTSTSQPRRHAISQETEFGSGSQSVQDKPSVNCGTEPCSKQPSQTDSASEPPFESLRPPSEIQEMERSHSRPRSSAADELKSFVDFGADSILAPAGEEESLDISSYGASNEHQPMNSAGTAGLDVVVSSPEAIIQTQPAYSVDPWKPEALGNTPEAPAPSISPASIMANPHRSAADDMRELLSRAFSSTGDSVTRSLMSQEPDDTIPPGTISPAAISRAADPLEPSRTLNLTNRGTVLSEVDSSGPSITMGQIPAEEDSDTSSQSSEQDHTQHIITLPMQASKRPYYGAIIKDHKAEIQAFSGLFTGDSGEQPDEVLVQKIHDLFGKLFDICDFPPDVVGTSLESEPSADIAKFCCDSNPKFNFLFELMTALDEKDKEILIVVRNQELMRLIFAVTKLAKIECSAESISQHTTFPSATRVTLALWDEDFNPFSFDVVIGYDYLYIRSHIHKQLTSGTGRKSPVVLLMVTTYSAEHVSLQPLENASPLEELNAMLACTVSAGRYLEDPERGYSEPHEVAEIFARHLNGVTDTSNWEPQGIPDDVLDIFASPMSQNQLLFAVESLPGNGLKRKFSDGDEVADAKRTRTLALRDPPAGSNNPPMSLATRRWLDSALLRGEANNRAATATVPVAVLDSLREQADEYKRKVSLAGEVEIELKNHINRLDKENKDYRKMSSKIGQSNRAAIEDRTVFEKKKTEAEAAAQSAKVAAQKEGDKYKQQIKELESTISRLKETPGVAEKEDAFATAQKQLRITEDKLKSALADVDFMRSRYQDVDSKASQLSNEVNALKIQNGQLQQRASTNLVAAQAQQASNERQAMSQQIASLRAQLQQKDTELAAAHQKINSFGRNTRGGSMPRSPRVAATGVSPRPSRAYAGSASRGTSPSGPGTQFMSYQNQNPRWNSLQ
ncbi:hypothetical protein NW768_000057 [Fusarium equiseti]|uniref:Chromo domain-containing protein n=1 Tax=Fusarium equiseti TaxID=61235 RepID=A0ABQ8RRV6_FUSEQ|nr:hypothetical protein NW768_000057 [Fusarium equiseti]